MTQRHSTRTSYDKLAADYATNLGDELAAKPLDRGLLDALAASVGDGVIADLGAGPGHVAGYLASRGATVLASDLSLQMCRTGAAREALPFVAADLCALPFTSGSLSGIACFYAVIHLDDADRARAYAEFARALRRGGQALIAFHTSDADAAVGTSRQATEMMGHGVELTFHFLDPDAEQVRLADAGLMFIARLDRAPLPDVEHPSRRSYLLVQRLV